MVGFRLRHDSDVASDRRRTRFRPSRADANDEDGLLPSFASLSLTSGNLSDDEAMLIVQDGHTSGDLSDDEDMLMVQDMLLVQDCQDDEQATPVGPSVSFSSTRTNGALLCSGALWRYMLGLVAFATFLLTLRITTSRTNLASRANGAQVVPVLTSPTHGEHWSRTFVRAIGYGALLSADTPQSDLLHEDIQCCWEFTGNRGHVAIRLREHVLVKSIRVLHPSIRHSPLANHAKAPRDLALWGLVDKRTIPPNATARPVTSFSTSFVWSRRSAFVLLGRYEFTLVRGSQWFSVEDHSPVNLVVLEVNTNWGSQSTCIYNVGIYA